MWLTATCIAFALLTPIAMGAPALWLLRGCRPLQHDDWIASPFLGIAIIVVVLQNLVYLDWPVASTAWLVWAACALCWLAFAQSGHMRRSLGTAPWRLFALAAAAYLFQGLGLFYLGVERYAGRAWTDMYNYTAIADFLRLKPFFSDDEATIISEAPYLSIALKLRFDRIGQSVLHAFFTDSSGATAKQMFGPTILLSVSLLVLAVAALGQRLGLSQRRAAMAAAAAGVLPAVALVHLECFLSQALAMPLLLFTPVALDRLQERPSPGRILQVGLLFTAVISIYTELTPLLGCLVALGLLVQCCRRPVAVRVMAAYVQAVALPFALNWHFLTQLAPSILTRIDLGLLNHVFPWSQTAVGWGCLWLGDVIATTRPIACICFLPLAALAYLGLALSAAQRSFQAWTMPACALAARTMVLSGSVLGIALAPIATTLLDDTLSYQHYKLLLLASPLLVLGMALLDPPAWLSARNANQNVAIRRACYIPLLVSCCIALLGTMRMTIGVGRLRNEDHSNACQVSHEDMLKIERALGVIQRSVLVVGDMHSTDRSWMIYYGRHHHVRLADGTLVDTNLATKPSAASVLNLDDLPDSLLFAAHLEKQFHRVELGAIKPLLGGQRMQLWQSMSGAWAFPMRIINNNGADKMAEPLQWLSDEPFQIEVLANQPGTITLGGDLSNGPCLPFAKQVRLKFGSSDGHCANACVVSGPAEFSFRIAAGRSTIYLHVLEKPECASPNGDPRCLLLRLERMSFFYKAEAATAQGH